MTLDLAPLKHQSRILFTIPLEPLQGDRFQPTGFPSLGAATYQTHGGLELLVESAQSMANRFEATCWDTATQKPVQALEGISHVTVTRSGQFLTDSMLEAHRINSPYILQDKTFVEKLTAELGGLAVGPIDRRKLAATLLRFDIGSLIHGVFLARKELAGGRLRVARLLSGFIEARGVRVAASGGVKNDHVNPSGVAKDGFGNVPFARDEFTAERIDCHVCIDLAQLHGYGLIEAAEELLTLLTLQRVRRLLDGDLRLRSACDFQVVKPERIVASRPAGFALPALTDLETALRPAISACAGLMTHESVAFEGKFVTRKDSKDDSGEEEDPEAGDGAGGGE